MSDEVKPEAPTVMPPEEGPPVAVAPAESVPCPLCREPVDPKAKLCKHCKSDLTWKRHVSVSNTTLALVTALLAVAGTVGPTVQKMLVPRDSKLDVVLIGSDPHAISMMLTNSGGKPVAVSRAVVVKKTNGGLQLYSDFSAVPPTVIEPSANKVVKFTVDFTSLAEFAKDSKIVSAPVGSCNYVVSGVKSDGVPFDERKDVQKCGDVILSYHLESEQLIRNGAIKASIAPKKIQVN